MSGEESVLVSVIGLISLGQKVKATISMENDAAVQISPQGHTCTIGITVVYRDDETTSTLIE